MTVVLALFMACAAPWTLGAGPSEVPPAPDHADPPEPEVHSVKSGSEGELSAAVAAFRAPYEAAARPTVGLLVLGPGDVAFERWRVDVVGVGLNGATAESLSGTEPLPGLPVSGWSERAAHVLQSTLTSGGVRVVDLPVAEWKPAEKGALPADLVFELRYVATEPTDQAQLRVLRLATGEVLTVNRSNISGRDARAFERATSLALSSTLQDLAGKL